MTVVCGPYEYDPESKTTITNPALVVEVTSDSTEDYDRGEKPEHYKRIPSLNVVVLVSHRERLVEVFERGEAGVWTRTEARRGATVDIKHGGVKLNVDEIYSGAELSG